LPKENAGRLVKKSKKFTLPQKWLKPKEDEFIVFEGAKAPAIFEAHCFPALKRGANDFFTGLLGNTGRSGRRSAGCHQPRWTVLQTFSEDF